MTATSPERFVLAPLADGGLLLDFQSGIVFTLNRTAAYVWQRALAGLDAPAIAAALSATFDVVPAAALADVEAALKCSPVHAFTPPLPTELRYEKVEGNYRAAANGVPVLEVATSGRALRVLPGFDLDDADVYLRAIAPKLVALFGGSVLHASAVVRPDGGVVAFLGASGAGKTTTARAFAGAGWKLICEDKLVVSSDDGRPRVVVGGEARVNTWISDTRQRLISSQRGVWCDAGPLADVASGGQASLADVVSLDRERRLGTEIRLRPLGQTEGAWQTFQHGFYGSADAHEWRRQLGIAVTIAQSARHFSAQMPEGLTALGSAAARYTQMTAS